MNKTWTEAQQRAIAERDRNLLLSAAAGSGKTAVLTERIVALVKEGARIDQFLVVTFTDAATAEMKRRISKRLLSASREEEDKARRDFLRTQSEAVSHANISTLHAFCLYILRRHFSSLGLDPAFTTADAILSGMLFQEALRAAADALYEAQDADFLLLLQAFQCSEEALFETAGRLHAFMMAQEEPFAWLADAVRVYGGGEAGLNPLFAERHKAHRLHARIQVEKLMQARALVPKEMESVRGILDADAAMIRALDLCTDMGQYTAALGALSFPALRWPKNAEALLKKRVTDTRDTVKKVLREQQAACTVTQMDEAARMAEMEPAIRGLAGFIREVQERYAAKKRERAKVDFHDMEHMALWALTNSEARSSLVSRFRYIFVDEYQDSNRIQERIVELVRRENNLFLVGDVKQSIYRFRQADPGLFIEKMHSYGQDALGEVIHLNTNFRSAQAVVDAVNSVFSAIMTEEAAEIAYDENAALRRLENAPDENAAYAGCELHIIDKGAEGGPDGESITDGEETEEEPPETAEAEAMLAACRIRELMGDARLREGGKERPLQYRDFAVLLRSHRRAGEIWAKTLAKEGIPAYVQLTGGYFDAVEVQVFLNLVRITDNLRQDIPLASALRSPVFRFNEEMLVEMKTQYDADFFHESLLLCAQGEGVLSKRAAEVLRTVERWRRESRLLPLIEFLTMLLQESGLYECMGALPGGKERQANLDALIERAGEYISAGGSQDIWSYLCYMDDAKNSADFGGAHTGAADVVRVLSMHKSKGLEFPVVILASLHKQINKTDEQQPILFDRELLIGARLVVGGVRKDTQLRAAIRERIRYKGMAEEMRVLYVGMTRAVMRLILIGSRKNAKEFIKEKGKTGLTPAVCMQAKSYLDWLLPVALQGRKMEVLVHPLAKAGPPRRDCLETTPEALDEEYARLDASLRWRYKYREATGIPSKLSVSALLHAQKDSLFDPPRFARPGRGLTAAERGVAAHSFLQELRLPLAGSAGAYIEDELGRMERDGILSAAQARAVGRGDMAWFMETEVFARMARAERLERELEFALLLPAGEVMDTQSGEPVLLQGVIDCCFMENGEWVLLDYKTDRAGEGDEEWAANKNAHQLQLMAYANALTALTGFPVKEKYLVLLRAHALMEM